MVKSLPFEHTVRIMFVFSKIGEEIVTHYDHDWENWSQEMDGLDLIKIRDFC